MQNQLLGFVIGGLVLMCGISLIFWPRKIQHWYIRQIETGGRISAKNIFLLGWKHPGATWTLRLIGVGATIMACVLFGQLFFGYPVSW